MVDKDLKAGIERTEEVSVSEELLATHLGSGTVGVYATPAMIALMERSSWKLVQPHLPEGYTTVGTEINVEHLRATPPGMKVRCSSVLDKVDGKRLYFSVDAWDERGKIGTGYHTRYIVETERFLEKAQQG
jgi:fluoroacetyl-CoA thioesterase